MFGLIETGRDLLASGKSALDVSETIVANMEMSGLYVAGKGGSPNSAGDYELDACIVDGDSGRAGAIACIQNYSHPIKIARQVMEQTPHVLLCGRGAEAFAHSILAEAIPNVTDWFTHAGAGESNFAARAAMGTVGCVVRDTEGHLASATSTAGVFDKVPGRIGDSPLIGAGAWADRNVAISCTGQGEFFMRIAAAANIAFLVEAGHTIKYSASVILSKIKSLGGEGGVAVVDRNCNVHLPTNAEGMKRARLNRDGSIEVYVFDEDIE